MSHYICIGSCQGVSDESGVCQNPDCSQYNQPLKECNCYDNQHKEDLGNSGNPEGSKPSNNPSPEEEKKSENQTSLFNQPLIEADNPTTPPISESPEDEDTEIPEDEDKQKHKLVTTAVIAFVLGFAVCYFTMSNRAVEQDQEPTGPSDEITQEEQKETQEEVEEVGEETGEQEQPSPVSEQILTDKTVVVVGNQTTGKKVNVTKVTMEKDGWIVIHDDRDGQPGIILGAYRFSKGTFNDIEMPLLVAMEEDKDYWAVIHNDNGDRQFDYKVDLSAKDADGNMIMTKFSVVGAEE